MQSDLNLTARTVQELDVVRERARRGFRVEKVRRDDVPEWRFIDGALQHKSKGFFSALGLAADGPQDRDRVMLFQPQSAVTGLLHARLGDELYFLIQARAEPGCLDEVQFGPTIQSTLANYMALHGGSSSPYADMFIAFDPQVSFIADTTQSDLGERYWMKCKRQIVAEYRGVLAARPGFVWASASAIREALRRSTYINIDLRSLFALTPWSADGDPALLSPASLLVQRSLQPPIRSDIIGAILARHPSRKSPMRTKPLEQLDNWTIDEWGLHEIERNQGFAIEFYRVHAALREVPSWGQPLINSATRGYCGLACRESAAEGIELQVRVVRETGLALGFGLAPTWLDYPGTRVTSKKRGQALAATLESDEGGRFYRDESSYEIVLSDGETGDPDCFWINVAELKALLNISNLCTIQLRGVASHLLSM